MLMYTCSAGDPGRARLPPARHAPGRPDGVCIHIYIYSIMCIYLSLSLYIYIYTHVIIHN